MIPVKDASTKAQTFLPDTGKKLTCQKQPVIDRQHGYIARSIEEEEMEQWSQQGILT